MENNKNFGTPPSTLESLGMTVQKWKDLELASRTQTPPFLFPGYRPRSQGQNSDRGIVPKAFVNGESPSSMYNIPDLEEMIFDHLWEDIKVPSCFTSWTPLIEVAFRFSAGHSIAMIDTKKLGNNQIYSLTSLVSAGLAFPEQYYEEFEYLVYGPVAGPGYYSLDLGSIGGKIPEIPPWVIGFEEDEKSLLGGYEGTAQTVVATVRDGLSRYTPTAGDSADSSFVEATIMLSSALMYLFRSTLADQDLAIAHLVESLAVEVAELKRRIVDKGKSVKSVFWNPLAVNVDKGYEPFMKMVLAIEDQIETGILANENR
ncbi:hypothetical protein GGR57DRAFT_506054 [Xylariaceae sp. FL1272]|nr:hypothetical protein GGR57DRAFT_506054 [Xylariaceae sp. FL1272]